jgi:3-deoxy-D-manno-octulosonic acid kinase
LRTPAPPLPPDFETLTFPGGTAVVRRDVAVAVRGAIAAAGTLHRWAGRQPGHRTFEGRGEVYGVALGPVRAAVRHARHGGSLAPLLGDRFLGRPRFHHEAALSRLLAGGGLRTPAVLAGVRYRLWPFHRADVATELIEGADLASLFYGDRPPEGDARGAVLEAVGRLVRQLHDLGHVHPDLQLRNIVVTGSRSPHPEAWLIDLDTCRPMRGRAEAERAHNLARFERSWAKWNRKRGARLTDQDRAVFSAAYLAELG